MVPLYAIEIQEKDIPLIRLVNKGVIPFYPKDKPSYFVFEASWSSNVPGEVVTEEELISRFEMVDRPHVLSIK